MFKTITPAFFAVALIVVGGTGAGEAVRSLRTLAHPPLTNARIPRERLGILALDIPRTMLSSPRATGTENVLGMDVVIRESTGPDKGAP